MNEVHTNGLVTTEFSRRNPIGQLAERVPALDDGSISLSSDGRMRVQYGLRKGVTWQDGAPFTASDLVFSYRLNSDPGLPVGNRDVLGLIQTVEAPDDHTVVFHFKQPYYMAGTLGFKGFWPQPRHLLESPYDRYVQGGNADQFLNLPYWTSEYIHLGAFRLAVFEPGESMTFEAYEGYFLGKPKLRTGGRSASMWRSSRLRRRTAEPGVSRQLSGMGGYRSVWRRWYPRQARGSSLQRAAVGR